MVKPRGGGNWLKWAGRRGGGSFSSSLAVLVLASYLASAFLPLLLCRRESK